MFDDFFSAVYLIGILAVCMNLFLISRRKYAHAHNLQIGKTMEAYMYLWIFFYREKEKERERNGSL